MKQLLLASLFMLAGFAAFAQRKETQTAKPDPAKKLYTVEAACGQCQLGLKGKGCSLAIRMDGKSYFVDGTGIDDHGDAHADDGFCNKIRKANVQGEVVDGRFKASYFELRSAEPKKQKAN